VYSQELTEKSDEELWRAFVAGTSAAAGSPGAAGNSAAADSGATGKGVAVRPSDAALDVLIGRYRRPLFWYLLLSTGKQDSAAQYTRNTWALLAAYRRPFQGFESFKGWLYAVATQNWVPATHPATFGFAELLDDLKRTEETSRRAKFFFLITELAPAERQPFLLVTVAGLTVPEAAKACRFDEERAWECLARAYGRLARAELFKRAEAADEL
jgi:DNA-directed RNA polymerase specialized sigma24 family protein